MSTEICAWVGSASSRTSRMARVPSVAFMSPVRNVSRPSSFTIVFTDSITLAEGSSSSTSGITSDLKGIEMPAQRICNPRMPATAATMSSVVKAL